MTTLAAMSEELFARLRMATIRMAKSIDLQESVERTRENRVSRPLCKRSHRTPRP